MMNYISVIKKSLKKLIAGCNGAMKIKRECTCSLNRKHCHSRIEILKHGNIALDSNELILCGKIKEQLEAAGKIMEKSLES